MNKLDIFKNLASLAVSIGVGTVVGNVVKSTTPSDLKMYSRVAVRIGGFVLSAIAVHQAQNYVSNEIDNIMRKVDPPIDDRGPLSTDL